MPAISSKKNGGQILSSDEQKTASLLCNAAIEARVIGLDRPAMSITGLSPRDHRHHAPLRRM